MKSPLSELAQYIKNIIPINIPETYNLKPMFENISDEKSIQDGVLAFRDFLYLFCDRLIEDGSLYDVPPKKAKDESSHPKFSDIYPFFNNVKSVLFNIGHYGVLSENGDSIILGDLQSLTSVVGEDGRHRRAKISRPKLIECLRFLSYCGIQFDGIDLDVEKPDISKVESLEITYPNNSIMLIGLKVMTIANRELHINNVNDDVFLRCDYRVLKDEETDVASVLKDIIHPLPVEVQDYVLKLHQRYLDAGLTCKPAWGNFGFKLTYAYKSTEIWSFTLGNGIGYRILIKAKKPINIRMLLKNSPCLYRKKFIEDMVVKRKDLVSLVNMVVMGLAFL